MRLRSPRFEHSKAHVILHFLAHFSIENSPVKEYTSGSVDIFVLGAKGEVFSDVPAVCGAPTGTESEQTTKPSAIDSRGIGIFDIVIRRAFGRRTGTDMELQTTQIGRFTNKRVYCLDNSVGTYIIGGNSSFCMSPRYSGYPVRK